MEPKRTSFLIIGADSPESYGPAGERLRHMALASSSLFDRVMILALRANRKENRQRRHQSAVYLYEINFWRAMPFPLSAYFDPVKMLMLLVHGLIISRRIKPSHILASMPPLEPGLGAWLLSKLTHARLVIDLRDDWELALSTILKPYLPRISIQILSIISRKIYSDASAVLAVTQTIADSVKKKGVATYVMLTPNGADTSVFTPVTSKARVKTRLQYTLPLNKLVAIYCGNGNSTYYRLDLLLASLRVLPTNVAQKLFLVFYLYNGVESLNKLKRQLGIPDTIVAIRKPLPRDQLAKVVAAGDIGLVPFDAKPYLLCARSTKLYEYLSSGLYVIGSGPKGGELDALLSSNPKLGMFVLPTPDNFTKAFGYVAENGVDFESEGLRSLRCWFIRENYDREKVMKKAMNALLVNTL